MHQLESQPRSTLLLFTLGAKREQQRRRLLPAALASEERALHHACLQVALEAGRSNACRLQVCSPMALELPEGCERLPQPGHSFGERLRSAMERARAGSDAPLVVVGSDVPDLRSAHLAEALRLLAGHQRRVVLGPASDGGIYLLAAQGPIEECFDEVRWCSSATRRSLVHALSQAGWEVVFIAPLGDLDRRSDLQSWLSRRGINTGGLRILAQRLRQALAALRRPTIASFLPRSGALLSTALSGRAPPF